MIRRARGHADYSVLAWVAAAAIVAVLALFGGSIYTIFILLQRVFA